MSDSTTVQEDKDFGAWFLADIMAWIADHIAPERVHDEDKLAQWAHDNGWIHENDTDKLNDWARANDWITLDDVGVFEEWARDNGWVKATEVV